MRFAVGLALALALAGPCAAADTFQLDLRAPAVVAPLDIGAQVTPVSFARVAANIPDGRVFAQFRSDIGCLLPQLHEHPDELHWRSGMNRIPDPEFEQMFRAELGKVGFKVSGDPDNLFQSAGETTDLQVGALITDFQARVCHSEWGSSVVDVEWQIYSTVAGKIVARISTRGGVQREKGTGRGELLVALLQKSFAENVRLLAADPAFRKIVLEPHAAAVATVTNGPLVVAYRTDSRPLPLKEATSGAVTIFAGEGMGSGVLISSDGYILTNHHVASAGRVRVRWPDHSESVGQVVRADSRRDVALIKVDAPKGRPLAIRLGSVDLGDTVYAIGTPLRDDLQNTVTRGVVSGMRTMDGESFIQSDTPITHGNSGGPLLDEKGAVVGLSDLGTDPALGSTINFFIPIGDALKVLALQPAS